MAKDEKLLIYFDDEAHLVRRLGAAVISCWGDLPEDVRLKLVGQAKRVMDDDEPDLVDRQIMRFIKDHTKVAA